MPLLPQHAWDKTSVTGKVGNYDETTAGAKAVYNFLQKQGGQMTHVRHQPAVEGRRRAVGSCRRSSSNGYYSYVPNKHYSGPDKPILSKVDQRAVHHRHRRAERAALGQQPGRRQPAAQRPPAGPGCSSRRGTRWPAMPIARRGRDHAEPLQRQRRARCCSQLYIRQALEDLIDRPQIVSKVYDGYADPGNGPVPMQASGPWVSPLEQSGGPVPVLAVHGDRPAEGARLEGGAAAARRPASARAPGRRTAAPGSPRASR